MKFFIKDLFSKCDQIRSLLRIWSHLMEKPLMENFIFCVVRPVAQNGLLLQFTVTKYVESSFDTIY